MFCTLCESEGLIGFINKTFMLGSCKKIEIKFSNDAFKVIKLHIFYMGQNL